MVYVEGKYNRKIDRYWNRFSDFSHKNNSGLFILYRALKDQTSVEFPANWFALNGTGEGTGKLLRMGTSVR